MARSWKRLDYLVHRWIGMPLGAMVLVWFLSGIVLMYYPWPALTESQERALLKPFDPPASLVGFAAAQRAAADRLSEQHGAGSAQPATLVAGRLMRWGNGLAYQLWGEQNGHYVSLALVDARRGAVLSPVSPAMAVAAARRIVGTAGDVTRIDLLQRGDHYMMNRGYAYEFPAYRVRFNDPHATAVYVGLRGGTPFGVVTSLTRFTTWFGTVPHWLYFQWLLQDHEGLWIAVNVFLPAVGVLLAITGIVLGCSQLFPRRRRGEWRPSPYRGVSKWHHLAGVLFGFAVLTWAFSGVLQMIGGSNQARPGQAFGARGGPVDWPGVRLTEAEALGRLRLALGAQALPVAIELYQFGGRPGFDLHLADGREFWVDAENGSVRGDLSRQQAVEAGRRIMGDTSRVSTVDRIASYDTYYYARPGREMHLPAWRIGFSDGEHSALYLDAINGTPVGFVDRSARRSRWLRDAIHSFDYPALNNRRPLWDLTILPFLLAGSVSALTGVWLLLRRVRRWV
jgi:hypothetical protein